MAEGKDLRIDLPEASVMRWEAGAQKDMVETTDSGFGVHSVTLPLRRSTPGDVLSVRVQGKSLRDGKAPKAFRFKVKIV